jgi:hypothetical protein
MPNETLISERLSAVADELEQLYGNFDFDPRADEWLIKLIARLRNTDHAETMEDRAKKFYSEQMSRHPATGYRPTSGYEPRISWMMTAFAESEIETAKREAVEEFVRRVGEEIDCLDFYSSDRVLKLAHDIAAEMIGTE